MKIKEGTSDAANVRKAVRGNVDAYGVLVEKYKDYLYRTAFLYTGNEEMALDVVQETLLRGFRGIKNLREPELFLTWLTRILINAAGDCRRQELRSGGTGGWEAEPAKQQEAYDGITAEERMDLHKAVQRLPDKDRTVIILSYFDGLRQEDISYVMGVPRSTVSVWLTRAKRELREYLEEDYLNG